MFSWAVSLNGSQKRNSDAAVSVGHNVYSFGGYYINDSNTNITIVADVFNTVSLRWKNLSPVMAERGHSHLHVPTKRFDHTAVLVEDVIYVFGGFKYTNRYRGEVCNDLYAFNVDTHGWLKPEVHGTVPGACRGHSACVSGKAMYVYGGSVRTNDMYRLDTHTMCWSFITSGSTTPEPASLYHSATIIGTKMFIFGGRGIHNNDIRVFDTATNSWLSTPSAQLLPEGRWGHSAFAYNDELYIFGGRNWTLDRNFNDLWRFNPETFLCAKVEPTGKGPRPTLGMCCCVVGDRAILFGGRNTPTHLYILDLRPSLKTLCKVSVIQYNMEQSELPHNIRWEMAAIDNSKQMSSP